MPEVLQKFLKGLSKADADEVWEWLDSKILEVFNS